MSEGDGQAIPGGRNGGIQGIVRYLPVAAMVVVVTLLHYLTSMHIPEAHGIYRRLYYFPIILAAFQGGLRAGLITATVVCLAYTPHAFGAIGHDPAPALEKSLEMALYLAVGLLVGLLVSRESATRRSLRQTAQDLRQALAEKARMEGQLVRAARLAAVGRLSAGLAHEIRNPLASIKGAAEILADEVPSKSPRGRLLRVLQEESRRLDHVLTRFLAFARPQRGERQTVDLGAEVQATVDLVRHRQGTALIVLQDEDRTAASVVGDPAQLRQLLLNLLLNGVQAAGEQGRVEVALAAGPGAVEVRVSDDGPGFSPEALENLGTPFFTTREGGTGLGLAISMRIAEDHGGRLTAHNRTPRGAEVVLTLPRGGSPAAAGAASAGAGRAGDRD
jgi:two-component system sensor histidine kinase HydH